MANFALIGFMIFTVILLFVAMVFSAMAATAAKKSPAECQKGCSKWSMWSALTTGLSLGVIVLILVLYIISARHKKKATLADILPNVTP